MTTAAIAFASCILTAGALGDRIGAKRVFSGGFALFTVASLACAFAPTTPTLTNRWVIGGMVAFVALVASSLFIERNAREPMLPLSLFTRQRFTVTAVVGLLVNVAFYGLIFVFSLYFQQINGYSPLETGLTFAPIMVAVFVTNLVAARVAARIGAASTIGAGAAVAAAGCVALLDIERGTSYPAISLPFIALGAGLGILVPPLTSMLLGSVDKASLGRRLRHAEFRAANRQRRRRGLFGSLVGGSLGFISGAHVAC